MCEREASHVLIQGKEGVKQLKATELRNLVTPSQQLKQKIDLLMLCKAPLIRSREVLLTLPWIPMIGLTRRNLVYFTLRLKYLNGSTEAHILSRMYSVMWFQEFRLEQREETCLLSLFFCLKLSQKISWKH